MGLAADWGDVPTWAATVATAATLAFLAVQWAHDRSRTANEAERRQAALFDAWAMSDLEERSDGSWTPGVSVSFMNSSPQSIRNVTVGWRPPADTAEPIPLRRLCDVAVVPPADKPMNLFVSLRERPAGFGQGIALTVAFSDSAGRRWIRYDDGRLERAERLDEEWLVA